MIRRATEGDEQFVRMVYGHKDIRGHVADDNTPPIEQLDVAAYLRVPNYYFLIPDDMGIFLFIPWNTTTFDVHAAILPEYRGRGTLDGVREAGMWMFENTTCAKIICSIRKENLKARAVAVRMGLKHEGIITKGILRHGQFRDLYVYGIHKEDVWSQ